MRANLMVYRDMTDPWLQRMRHTPEAALQEIMPNLRKLSGDFRVEGPVQIRPCRSLRHQWTSAGRDCSGRRRILDLLPRSRKGDHEGVHRRRAAVQYLCSSVARESGHGCSKNRAVLRRSRENARRTRIPHTRHLHCARCRSTPASRGTRAAGLASAHVLLSENSGT